MEILPSGIHYTYEKTQFCTVQETGGGGGGERDVNNSRFFLTENLPHIYYILGLKFFFFGQALVFTYPFILNGAVCCTELSLFKPIKLAP